MAATLNLPCPNRVVCDTENPLQNLSTEAPDRQVAISVFFPNRPVPLGRSFTSSGCVGVCTSSISQEDADLCAARQAVSCFVNPPCTFNCTPPPPPVCVTPAGCSFIPGGGTGGGGPPPTIAVCNTVQVCCVLCPDGTQFCYTVPACTFLGASVEEANAIAYSYACKQAAFAKLCINGTPPEGCTGQNYSATLTAFGGVTTTHDWQLVSGSLPPGLVTSTNQDGSNLFITGVPTTGGTYTFTFRVVDGLGNFMIKTYTIVVLELTSGDPPNAQSGVAYSFQFTGSGGTPPYTFTVQGTLPPGLTLSSSGLLSGTPTGDGSSYNFSVCFTDSGGN